MSAPDSWDVYNERFWAEILPPLMGSSVYCARSLPRDFKMDLRYATELGVAILSNKPILLIVMAGEVVSDSLRTVAAAVVEIASMDDQKGRDAIASAARRLTLESLMPE